MKEYKLKDLNPLKNRQYRINYQEELNTAQLHAAEIKGGPALVIAGAGTGKTRTLVYRVARLVEDGIPPESILLLTFTRKAAKEMLRRASGLLDERCGHVSGGTFHSFANQMLRRYSKYVGFSENFTILDRKDAEDIVGLVRNRLGFFRSKKRFPQKDTISEIFSKSINKDIPVKNVIAEDYAHFLENWQDLVKIEEEYLAYKKSKCIMDYDDLLIYLEQLLRENDEIRRKISNFYRYIMIDEFQDTNKLQAKIAYKLADEHKNIMVVGDDSQSIYSFRGANFKNIMDFPVHYPDARIIKLEQNYRSTQPVLDFTNQIIKYAKEKYEKNLFSDMESSQKPVYIETENENWQSKFIVQRVLELREEGVALNDIAVLFRSAWQSMDLEIELNTHNIPFIKFGGIKFSEAAHIKDVLSYLKVAYNNMDAVSWMRILLLIEGIGPHHAHQITSAIIDGENGKEFLIDERNYSKKYGSELKKLHKLIKEIELTIGNRRAKLAEKMRMVTDYYKPFLKEKYDDYHKRLDDLASLEMIAARYESLQEFLTDLTLEPVDERQLKVTPEDDEDENLILSTIHSAKGLEWHSVFIISLIDGYLPSSYAVRSSEEIEEERRLLYVAATRAAKNLYLIKPGAGRISGNYFDPSFQRFSEVCRFLNEGDILENYVEKWVLKEESNDTIN
ncbi:MAG: ATP-dependent DNA helicase PcrA [Actinobacteria bacterium ADurb.Bin346]|nr:MAG: ATP-dependent DNA helicase PcrA [Actinobacteria bacterium ADurb.Bin346]